MKKRIGTLGVALVFLLCFSTPASADIGLAPILSDNMVLQQNSSISLWGRADPGERVLISAGWMKSTVSVIAGRDGQWVARIKTTKAGGPYSMTLKGKNTLVLKNIMLGEVWVCSGQSNMEFTIKMLGGWEGFYKADREELAKRHPIRLFTVTKDTSSVPLDACKGRWLVGDAEAVENFSATAYFFGRELQKRLGVPIGLISSSWGGTPAEAWTSMGYIKSNKDLEFYIDEPNRNVWFPARPAVLYNAMIHPLIKFAIKGVIWYQGESNRNDARLYHKLMSALIDNWRNDWGIGTFPFYYVQIAPFKYDEPFSGALLREAQLKTMSVPGTGMAVTMDIGDTNDIHPKNKQEVGRRLALWALARTYGVKVPAFSGPVYRSMEREGNAVRLFFDYADKGLTLRGNKPGDFVVAGPDRAFVDADARIEGNTVVVSSSRVANPVAVRFAFTNTSTAGLFTRDGLPASSFRTDDWPIVTQPVSIAAAYDSATNATVFEALSKVRNIEIRYTLDGSEPNLSSPVSQGRVSLAHSALINARAFIDGIGSTAIAHCEFTRHAAIGKAPAYAILPDSRFPGGKFCLVDGLTGSMNFMDGSWQGFKKDDLDVTIDLGDTISITRIRSEYLQNTGSWIFFPKIVEYSVSRDGKIFTLAATLVNDVSDSTAGTLTKQFSTLLQSTTARFVKAKAKNIGQCPAWHPGRGGDAWLFVDEIIVE